MHTAGRILCLLAALYTVNAHLYLGQGIAWVTMIQDRAPKLGLTEAVADILSGAHPCDRCLAVAAEPGTLQSQIIDEIPSPPPRKA
ncbi:MAG: hypothetical protein OSA48_00760 [Akkermansiaceae bacterium]|nr:hypothetical protein [Akkermansiaceae bacterium]